MREAESPMSKDRFHRGSQMELAKSEGSRAPTALNLEVDVVAEARRRGFCSV